MATVALYDSSYESIDETIDRLFSDFNLNLTGKRVLIKPNMLGPFDPARGITTHPAVVRALVRKLREQGATPVVGDNPGMRGYGANVTCAERSGIMDASLGTYVNLSAEKETVRTNSPIFDGMVVSKEILECDYYISVPKFKTHVVTNITGAIKNNFGILVGGQKAEVHRKAKKTVDFAGAVVDVYSVRQPDFVVMDAIVAMEGNGPSSKDLRSDVGKILAGPNGVEVDTVMATMMGLKPADVPLLTIAHEKGLGEIDLKKIDLPHKVTPIEGFKLPSVFAKTFFARLLTYFMVHQPVVRQELCQQCGLCVKQCPVGAITFDTYPVIDKKRCISCFCCYEYCEHNAMDIASMVKFFRKSIDY